MLTIPTLLVLVPGLPLMAAVATAVLGAKVLRERSHIPVVAAIGLSCLASIALVFQVRHEAHEAREDHSQVGYERVVELWRDRKSTRLNSSHIPLSRMPSSA